MIYRTANSTLYLFGGVGAPGTTYGDTWRMTCSAVCYPNCDGSTATPILNVADFICYLNRFAAGDSYANCDGSTAAPTLNVADFICFLNKYGIGC
jgi:hypothetical protein